MKRTDLSKLVRAKAERESGGRKMAKQKSLTRIVVGHTRFATTSKATFDGTHPHQWSPPQVVRAYAQDQKTPGATSVRVENFITHNGDFDFYNVNGAWVELGDVQAYLARATGFGAPSVVDSAAIAGVVDLLRAQGSFALAARFAVCLDMKTASADADTPVPSLAEFEALGAVFERELDAALTAGGARRSVREIGFDLARRGRALVAGVRARFEAPENVAALDCLAHWLDAERGGSLAAFVESATDAFFDNDSFFATRTFLSNAKGSFGLMVTNSLDATRQLCLAARGQTLSVAFYPKKGLVCYGSEQAAVKAGLGARTPGDAEGDEAAGDDAARDDERDATRLDLDDLNGEVCLLDWGEGRRGVSAEPTVRDVPADGGRAQRRAGHGRARRARARRGRRPSRISASESKIRRRDGVAKDGVDAAPASPRDVRVDDAPRLGVFKEGAVPPHDPAGGQRVHQAAGAGPAGPGGRRRARRPARSARHPGGLAEQAEGDDFPEPADGLEPVPVFAAAARPARERHDQEPPLGGRGRDRVRGFAVARGAVRRRPGQRVPAPGCALGERNKILGLFGQDLPVPAIGHPRGKRNDDFTDSIVIVVSHSGGTFAPLASSNLLVSSTSAIFVVASEWDTQIGKQLRAVKGDGAFTSRIFSTDVGVRPAEPCSVSVAATQQLLTQIFMHVSLVILGNKAYANVTGAAITKHDLAELERCNRESIAALEDIVGARAADGARFESQTEKQLRAQGDVWADHVLEGVKGWILSFVYIVVTVTLGYPLVTGVATGAERRGRVGVLRHALLRRAAVRVPAPDLHHGDPPVAGPRLEAPHDRAHGGHRGRPVGRAERGGVPLEDFRVRVQRRGDHRLVGNPATTSCTGTRTVSCAARCSWSAGRTGALARSPPRRPPCRCRLRKRRASKVSAARARASRSATRRTSSHSRNAIFLKRHRPLFLCERVLREREGEAGLDGRSPGSLLGAYNAFHEEGAEVSIHTLTHENAVRVLTEARIKASRQKGT